MNTSFLTGTMSVVENLLGLKKYPAAVVWLLLQDGNICGYVGLLVSLSLFRTSIPFDKYQPAVRVLRVWDMMGHTCFQIWRIVADPKEHLIHTSLGTDFELMDRLTRVALTSLAALSWPSPSIPCTSGIRRRKYAMSTLRTSLSIHTCLANGSPKVDGSPEAGPCKSF